MTSRAMARARASAGVRAGASASAMPLPTPLSKGLQRAAPSRMLTWGRGSLLGSIGLGHSDSGR